MTTNELEYFADLDFKKFPQRIFVLDIDGTITNDGSAELDDSILTILERLKQERQVYFCSNGKDPNRRELLTSLTGIEFIGVNRRKPDPYILREARISNFDTLIIGDKYLTDLRFAKYSGATFVKVKRIVSRCDSLLTKFAYILDDYFYGLHRAGWLEWF